MGKLMLKPEQDGMGYFYGTYEGDDGEHVRVDVLPPKSFPRPLFAMGRPAEQDDTAWIVYANGHELARVTRREDVDALDVVKLLLAKG